MGSVGGRNKTYTTTEMKDLFNNALKIKDKQTYKELQDKLEMSGDDLGRPHDENTLLVGAFNKSDMINRYLRTDGDRFTEDDLWWQRDMAEKYSKEQAAQDIAKIDSYMKPSPQDIVVTRYTDDRQLEKLLGQKVNISEMIKAVEQGGASKKDVISSIDGKSYVEKGYTHTSWGRKSPVFVDTNPVKLEMVVKKGTPIYLTNNHAESEVVVGRNVRYTVTPYAKFEYVHGKMASRKVVLRVVVSSDKG